MILRICPSDVDEQKARFAALIKLEDHNDLTRAILRFDFEEVKRLVAAAPSDNDRKNLVNRRPYRHYKTALMFAADLGQSVHPYRSPPPIFRSPGPEFYADP